MRQLFIFAIILIAGCTSGVPEGTGTPADGRTGSFGECLERCSSGPGSGPYCEDGCRFEQAENTKDTSYCDQLDQKGNIPECYGTVAVAAGDISICERLADAEDYNHCIAAFSPR